MGTQTTRAALAAAAAILGLGIAACGSDGGSDATTPEQTAASSSASANSAAPGSRAEPAPDQTVGDYLRDNNITQTVVVRGNPTAPQLDLPMPTGWKDVGADTPPDSYGAIVLESAADAPNPPAIIARMVRLGGGEIDQATILELAPNAVRKLPGWEGPAAGRPATLSGFDATEIAGTASQQGQPMFVARKTVVIPGKDGVYLLALDAQSTPDQKQAVIEAMSVIDAETKVTP